MYNERSDLSALIIIPGGIGSGFNGSSIPIIEDYVKGVSLRCKTTVISLSCVSKDYQPDGFLLYDLNINHDASIFVKLIKFFKLAGIQLKHEKYSVIHGIWTFPSTFFGAILSKIRNIPLVAGLQGGCMADLSIGGFDYGGNQGLFKKLINKWTLKMATCITAETIFQKELLEDERLLKKVNIIYSGRRCPVAMTRKRLQPHVKFVHVANLTPIKDQITLLDTFAILKSRISCSLSIIGPDYNSNSIQEYAQQLDLADDVRFLGQLPNHDVITQLRQHDIMIHTSLYEGGALVIVEAMVNGVVVAGTRVGHLYDLGDEYFVISEIGQSSELAEKILALVADEDRYHTLRSNAYHWALEHSLDTMCDSFYRLYESARIS